MPSFDAKTDDFITVTNNVTNRTGLVDRNINMNNRCGINDTGIIFISEKI